MRQVWRGDERLDQAAQERFLVEARARALQLGGFARVTVFDKRGMGMSDRMSCALPLEERVEDLTAVMEALRTDSAVLFGIQGGGALAAADAAWLGESDAILEATEHFLRGSVGATCQRTVVHTATRSEAEGAFRDPVQ